MKKNAPTVEQLTADLLAANAKLSKVYEEIRRLNSDIERMSQNADLILEKIQAEARKYDIETAHENADKILSHFTTDNRSPANKAGLFYCLFCYICKNLLKMEALLLKSICLALMCQFTDTVLLKFGVWEAVETKANIKIYMINLIYKAVQCDFCRTWWLCLALSTIFCYLPSIIYIAIFATILKQIINRILLW